MTGGWRVLSDRLGPAWLVFGIRLGLSVPECVAMPTRMMRGRGGPIRAE